MPVILRSKTAWQIKAMSGTSVVFFFSSENCHFTAVKANVIDDLKHHYVIHSRGLLFIDSHVKTLTDRKSN